MISLIVFKSLRQHALSTIVTALSIALAGGLLMSVWAVKEQARSTFTQMTGGFDGVFGARSSKLQLVLNAIFHLEASPANLTPEDIKMVTNHASVALSVPIAMGDNYEGYRVVGTTPAMFTEVEVLEGQPHEIQVPGRIFDPTLREAVIGSFAARKLGLKAGDKFSPYHGLNFDEDHQHEEDYLVVGVLKPSNSPADRVIWIPLSGVQHMSGHAEESNDEVSAILVRLRSPMAGQTLDRQFNREGDRLTFAWPIGATMASLLNKISWIDRVLALVAYLVALVAAASILASIYNSMNERRRQIALMRALGAHRITLFTTVVLEAVVIATLGMIAAYGIYLGIMMAAASIIQAQTGVVLDPWAWHAVLVLAPLAMIGLGALAGFVPAGKAYRVDVAENLAPSH